MDSDTPIPWSTFEVGDVAISSYAGDSGAPDSIYFSRDGSSWTQAQAATLGASASSSGNVTAVIRYLVITQAIYDAAEATASGSDLYIRISCASSYATAVSFYHAKGLDSSPLDKAAGSTGSGTSPSSGATDTLSQADELAIGAIGTEGPNDDTQGTWTTGAGYVSGNELWAGTNANGATANVCISSAAEIVSATTAQTAAKTGITDRDWAACVATFKGAGSGTVTGATAMSGTGALTASANLFVLAQSAMSGVGALTAAGDTLVNYVTGAVPMSGAGTLDADAYMVALGQSAMSGAGALTSGSHLFRVGVVPMSGTGSLTANAFLYVLGPAALSGQGALTAAGDKLVPIVSGSTTMTGSGALTASSLVYVYAVAPLSGTGSLSSDTMVYVLASAPLSGAGVMTVSADVLGIVSGSVAMTGAGALSADALLTILAQSTLSGTGSLVSGGDVIGAVTAQVAMSGTGALTADAVLTILAQAALSGLGTMTPGGYVVPPPGSVTPPERIVAVRFDLKELQVALEDRGPEEREDLRQVMIMVEQRMRAIQPETRLFAPQNGQVD